MCTAIECGDEYSFCESYVSSEASSNLHMSSFRDIFRHRLKATCGPVSHSLRSLLTHSSCLNGLCARLCQPEPEVQSRTNTSTSPHQPPIFIELMSSPRPPPRSIALSCSARIPPAGAIKGNNSPSCFSSSVASASRNLVSSILYTSSKET